MWGVLKVSSSEVGHVSCMARLLGTKAPEIFIEGFNKSITNRYANYSINVTGLWGSSIYEAYCYLEHKGVGSNMAIMREKRVGIATSRLCTEKPEPIDSNTTIVITKDQVMDPTEIITSSCGIESVQVSPSLPLGLLLSLSSYGLCLSGLSGSVLGEKKFNVNITARIDYPTNNQIYWWFVPIELYITVKDIAPGNFSYTLPLSYTLGVTIPPNKPHPAPDDDALRGAIITYGVSPSLPFGMDFSSETGTISGRPLVPHHGTFVVTGMNSGGAIHSSILLNIVLPAVPASSEVTYIQQIVNFPDISSVFAYNSTTKTVLEVSYAICIGIYDVEKNQYRDGCSMSSGIRTGRRALAIDLHALVSPFVSQQAVQATGKLSPEH